MSNLFIKIDLVTGTIKNSNPVELTTEKDLYFPIKEYFIMTPCSYNINDESIISQEAYCIIHFDNIDGLQAEMLTGVKEGTLKLLTIAETISDKDKKKIYATKKMEDPLVLGLNFQVSSNGNDVMMFFQFKTLNIDLNVIDGETQKSQGNLAGSVTTAPTD